MPPSLQGYLVPRLTPLLKRRNLTYCPTWAETSSPLRPPRLPLLPTLPTLHIFRTSQVKECFPNMFDQIKKQHHHNRVHCVITPCIFLTLLCFKILFPHFIVLVVSSCRVAAAPQGNSDTNFANFEAFGNTAIPSHLSTSPPSKSFPSGTSPNHLFLQSPSFPFLCLSDLHHRVRPWLLCSVQDFSSLKCVAPSNL